MSNNNRKKIIFAFGVIFLLSAFYFDRSRAVAITSKIPLSEFSRSGLPGHPRRSRPKSGGVYRPPLSICLNAVRDAGFRNDYLRGDSIHGFRSEEHTSELQSQFH